jgi:putative tricarboxylic transport membrane protein
LSDHKKRLPGEFTFTCLLLLGSLFLLHQSYGISGFESITSAGMFPMMSALVMVLTVAVALHHTFKATLNLSEGDSVTHQFVRQISPMVFVYFTLTVFAFMLLLPRLGFVVSAFVFLVVAMRLLGSKRWGLNFVLSAASLGAVYVIFQKVFSVVLPKGTWLVNLGA